MPITADSVLHRVDLNLLVAFDALAREGSVTRAAAQVGITQSAMSHTLRRLRALFDDPVLVRARGRMVLTPRAEALIIPVRRGLTTLSRALSEPAVFDPATAQRGFKIASPDLFDALVLPPLLERLRAEAPCVDLAVVPLSGRQVDEALETGELDVAVTASLPTQRDAASAPVAGLRRRVLLRDRFSCFLRADHPALAAGAGLTLDAYLALSHALVSPTGQGPGVVEAFLPAGHTQRRVALRLPSFALAPAIIAESDLVLTAPASLAAVLHGLPVVATPLPVAMPDHTVAMVWHERFSQDPGHAWFRGLLAAAAESRG